MGGADDHGERAQHTPPAGALSRNLAARGALTGGGNTVQEPTMPILLWVLGVPITLIIVLLLLGVL